MSSIENGAGYEISTDPARLDTAAMHAYLTRSYWSPGIPLETVERAARNSLCFGLYEKASDKQVGLTRVVTDHATFAYLCDVYGLYSQYGFGAPPADGVLMQILRPDIYRTAGSA